MDQALTTKKEAELIHKMYELEYGLALPPEELAAQQLVLIMGAAEQQIKAETRPDSPWQVLVVDKPNVIDHKEKMFQFEVAKRALEIAERRRAASELIQFKIVGEIQKRKLHNYPADGTWRELADIIREILPDSGSGSVISVLGFVDQMNGFDALGVDGVDTLAHIAAEKKYILGYMQMAMNRIIDEDTTPEEKKDAVEQLVEDASKLSISKFNAIHNPMQKPRIPYYTWTLPDGRKMWILQTNEDQETILKGRMRGKMELQIDDLFRPITPGAIYELLVAAAEEGPRVVPLILPLLKRAVLSTSREYSIYQALDHQRGDEDEHLWCDVNTIKPLVPMLGIPAVTESLNTLTYYGLVEKMEIKGSMTLWQVKM